MILTKIINFLTCLSLTIGKKEIYVIPLSLLFATFKLLGIIHWNWFWIFFPVIFTGSWIIIIFLIVLTFNKPTITKGKKK